GSPAAAHPHIWIEYAAVVLFDGEALKGVRFTWTFDSMYSSMLFHDYTSRPRGGLTPADIKKLQKGAFEDTRDQHYFVEVKLNGKPVAFQQASDFSASYEGGRMSYSFTIPVRLETPLAQNTIEIAAFDTEFYIDFELAKKNPVSSENGERAGVVCAPKQVAKQTTIFGALEIPVAACTFGKVS